jgi:aspartate carbamoyltransferase catalytic subunit
MAYRFFLKREGNMAAPEVYTNMETAAAQPGWLDQPIDGDAAGKNLLSVRQLSEADTYAYIDEALAAKEAIRQQRGIAAAPFAIMKIVMEQPSTRTAGSMLTAIQKIGGNGEVIKDLKATSEAKGETKEDAWVAFATQADIIGLRSAKEDGCRFAAAAIAESYNLGKLERITPVINLGNGKDEHPTQWLGDVFNIYQRFDGQLKGLTIAVAGDHERYRAHHSTLLGAARVGMRVIAVESEAAPVPEDIKNELGDRLKITRDFDEALEAADVFSMGRNPDEYSGNDADEQARSAQLAHDYELWTTDYDRLQRMKSTAIMTHPRPRRNELHPSIDGDRRAADVEQMANMIPMRMAIAATHLGESISQKWQLLQQNVTHLEVAR